MLHFAISLIMNINLAQSPRPLQRKRKKNAITAVVVLLISRYVVLFDLLVVVGSVVAVATT
jgi:hypothetical protein